MIAAVKPPDRIVAFPENEIITALHKWWAEEALERAEDPFSPALKPTGTLYDLLPALDSLSIMRSFLTVKKILKKEVPVGLVKPGGYYSREEMLKDLLPKLRKLHEQTET